MANPKTTLLSCPFCGLPMSIEPARHKPPHYSELWSAGCDNLPGCGYGRMFRTQEKAIAWVNTRAEIANVR
jgi:hypothetical protein